MKGKIMLQVEKVVRQEVEAVPGHPDFQTKTEEITFRSIDPSDSPFEARRFLVEHLGSAP